MTTSATCGATRSQTRTSTRSSQKTTAWRSAASRSDDVFLRNLYVVPERWRSGVGTALHDLALERLRVRGNGEAKLWTLEENRNGRRFYENRGWTLNGETRVVPFPPNPIDVGYSKAL